MPKCSVIIPSFNHEKYIRACIQSVLDQSFKDFEIVITDDGSSDRTVDIINKFNDPRIRLYTHGNNKGACVAINNCIKKALGEYIAVLNSDDVWEPTKLEKQVAYLDDHSEVGAVFSKVSFIDESGNLISNGNFKYLNVFETVNRSRYEWLNHFFYKGNCLCHPSILIRKVCYADIGFYDERMASIPDLDMWVRLCLKYEIYILEEKLVRFRIRSDNENASCDLPTNNIRIRFEFIQILNHYLMIKNKQFLLKVFPEIREYGNIENKYIPYFLSMLALNNASNFMNFWGLGILYNFLGKETNAIALERKYGFRYQDFYDLTAKYDVFNTALLFKVKKIAIRMYRSLAKVVRNLLKDKLRCN